eukprot:77729-Chlamydomonas_euryale.AAC.1
MSGVGELPCERMSRCGGRGRPSSPGGKCERSACATSGGADSSCISLCSCSDSFIAPSIVRAVSSSSTCSGSPGKRKLREVESVGWVCVWGGGKGSYSDCPAAPKAQAARRFDRWRVWDGEGGGVCWDCPTALRSQKVGSCIGQCFCGWGIRQCRPALHAIH